MKRINKLGLFVLVLMGALFATSLSALAQTTGTLPPLPKTASEYWVLAIAGLTPLIVNGIKKLVPKLPVWLLPLSTPFLGVGLGYGMNALTSANLGWVDMAQAGALAVFVREVWNQTVTKAMATTPPTPPTT